MHDGPTRSHIRWVAGFVALFFVLTAGYAGSARADEPGDSTTSSPVVFIGFSGVTWDNISEEDTPHLWEFASEAAGANSVVRTVRETTCPVEGWLTLGAGQRTRDVNNSCRTIAGPEPSSDMAVGHWDDYLRANENNKFDAQLGVLGDALDGHKLGAIGPGAAVALATAHGSLTADYADVGPLPGSVEGSKAGAPDPDTATAARAFADMASGKDLVMIDLGSVRYPEALLTERASAEVKESDPFRDSLKSVSAAFRSLGDAPDSVMDQVRALDARFGELWAEVQKYPGATVVVASVADSQSSAAQLGFFAMRGPGAESVGAESPAVESSESAALPGLAMSDATRQYGLVQTTDLLPTLLTEVAPGSAALEASIGSPIFAARGIDSIQQLVDRLEGDNQRAMVTRPLIGPFYVTMLVLALVVIVNGALRVRRPAGATAAGSDTEEASAGRDAGTKEVVAHREASTNKAGMKDAGTTKARADVKRASSSASSPEARTRNFIQLCAVVAAIPVASLLVNLLPWWNFEYPAWGLFGGIAFIAGLIAWAGTSRRWSDQVHAPMMVVAVTTAATLIGDVTLDRLITQYPLQLASVLNQPQVGGRYYGFSNATFIMFTVSMLLIAAYGAERLNRAGARRSAAVTVVLLGVFTVYLDGSAGFGADFGGPPAIIVGFAALLVMVLRMPLTGPRILGVLGAAIIASFVFAWIDYQRPPDERSHLGRFIQTLLNGGGVEVISRKLSAAFFGMPWAVIAILLVVISVGVVVMWRLHSTGVLRGRFGRAFEGTILAAALRDLPVLRGSLLGVGAAVFVGPLINDSSVVIPAMGLTIAAPLWVIAALRHDDAA